MVQNIKIKFSEDTDKDTGDEIIKINRTYLFDCTIDFDYDNHTYTLTPHIETIESDNPDRKNNWIADSVSGGVVIIAQDLGL